MIYSNACEYAIRALSYLVGYSQTERVLVRVISEKEDIPGPFLGKIFQTLAKQGLLVSTKGPGGGFALARAAEEITLLDIKAAVDGTADLDACAAGLDMCSDEVHCPLHDTWKPIRENIRTYLTSTTLAAIAAARDEKAKQLKARRS